MIVLLGTFVCRKFEATLNAQLQIHGEITVQRLATTLRYPLWTLDKTLGRAVMEAEVIDPRVAGAIVFEKTGDTERQFLGLREDGHGQIEQYQGGGDCTGIQSEQILQDGMPIGRVALYLDNSQLVAEMKTISTIAWIVESAMCVLVVLVAAVGWMLYRSRELALAISRSKSEFLANMSHEIRTPMTGVIGMTDLVLGTDLNDDQRDYVSTIRQCAGSLISVINDILDFSKVEAGMLTINMRPYSPATVVEACLRMIGASVLAKQQTLVVELDELPLVVKGDPDRLNQVLMNLLGNAVKFTPENGKIVVSAAVMSKPDTGMELQFSIADSGIGISEPDQKRIFDAFTQADGSATRRFGGTGLGLAISRHLVELMGGTIWVESSPGEGSCFRFGIATGNLTALEAAAFTPVLSNERSVCSLEIKPLRILVAEDNRVNQRLAVKLLERRGHIVQVAENGHQVLELLDRSRFDIILMDIHMPLMDGIEATRKIRGSTDGSKRNIPIVALTASALDVERESYLSAGMNECVPKPFDAAQLEDVLTRLVPGESAD